MIYNIKTKDEKFSDQVQSCLRIAKTGFAVEEVFTDYSIFNFEKAKHLFVFAKNDSTAEELAVCIAVQAKITDHENMYFLSKEK